MLFSIKMEVSASSKTGVSASACEKKAAVVPEKASRSTDAHKKTLPLVSFAGQGCAVLAWQDMRLCF